MTISRWSAWAEGPGVEYQVSDLTEDDLDMNEECGDSGSWPTLDEAVEAARYGIEEGMSCGDLHYDEGERLVVVVVEDGVLRAAYYRLQVYSIHLCPE